MTTLTTRDQMWPGRIVQRVATYRVLPTTWAEAITWADRKARQA